jgi:hypothetical protein
MYVGATTQRHEGHFASLAVAATLPPATVPAQHAKSKPNQRPNHGNDEGIQPKRPVKMPHQEMESDFLGVLGDEDGQQADTDKCRNGPSAQPPFA